MTFEQAITLIEASGLPSASLTQEAFQRLSSFVALRAQWARTHNLSGPKALAAPWSMDVIDGIALNDLLDDTLPLFDVGAGSGVPGLIVGALKPERPLNLVEPLTKRVAFLRTAASRLGLKATKVTHGKWPVDPGAPCQVISRAVVSPDSWPTLAVAAGPLVRTFYRYLAAQRPDVTVEGYTLSAAVDYSTPERGQLRLERWDLQTET